MSSSPVAWRRASSRSRPAICGSTESRERFMRSLEMVVLVMKNPGLAMRHPQAKSGLRGDFIEWVAESQFRGSGSSLASSAPYPDHSSKRSRFTRLAETNGILAANHSHLNESPSLLRPTSPNQGGIANQCQYLEEIFCETSHGRGGDAGLFYYSRACCRLRSWR